MRCKADNDRVFQIVRGTFITNFLVAVIFTSICIVINQYFLFDSFEKVLISSALGSGVYLVAYISSSFFIAGEARATVIPEMVLFSYIIVFIIKFTVLITLCTIIFKFIPISYFIFFLAFILQIITQQTVLVTCAFRIKQE
jgi:hypothetical protein